MGVLGGDRRPLAVADQLLADPAGDARLRAAVVELAGASMERVFGARRPGRARASDADALADAIERLLDDDELWQRRSAAGATFVTPHTWDAAAEQVEAGSGRHCGSARRARTTPPSRPSRGRRRSRAADAGRAPRA